MAVLWYANRSIEQQPACRNWFKGLVDDDAEEEHPVDVGGDAGAHTVQEDMHGDRVHLDEFRRQVGGHHEAVKRAHASGAVGQYLSGACASKGLTVHIHRRIQNCSM